MGRSFEGQWDRERGTVTLVAQAEGDLKADRYAITVPAATREEANEAARQFKLMYEIAERGGDDE